ncbi:hypothetical protein [uncultured Methanobrevibacter sp.]|jgi:hypothetical protein|uniref:hypothetical protein n=1 Tax=uncultured Methanobrevibacter sp. TaxID=253161 RepID=UPI0025F4144A|nr:hypothetical protein [uncultured Methanobrevibacter sp.]
MAKDKEAEFEKEIERLAHKSNVNIRKSEFAFETQLKNLDKEIDNVMKNKFKEFDKNKELTSEYLNINYTDDSIKRYREKLKKI